jgi:hypothetical protein
MGNFPSGGVLRMHVEFPTDERSLKYIEALGDDPDIKAILSILLDKRSEDFHNYASIICFCYREDDLINLPEVKHLPKKVKAWVKRKSFEHDATYLKFFTHLFSLYSSFSQTYEGWDRLGKFRSLFPESYVYHRLMDRYGSRPEVVVSRECYVVINGWDSRRQRTKKQGQKIDVGMWDRAEQKGKAFEAKVKAYISEKEHQLDFLETIREVSKKRIDVILASFAPKEVVLSHLKSFFPKRDISKINIFGIDELKNL